MNTISNIVLEEKHSRQTVVEEQQSTITEYGLAVLKAKRDEVTQMNGFLIRPQA
jgi:acyl-CoA hydrolase